MRQKSERLVLKLPQEFETVIQVKETIYIIDPDQNSVDSITQQLDSHDASVVSFKNGNSFLDWVDQAEQPLAGCILVEFALPEQTSHEFMAKLRHHENSLPVIVMYSQATVQDACEGLRRGAIDFLAKPLDPMILVERLEEAIEKDRHLRQLQARILEIHKKITSLSPRQRQVMELVCDGLPTKTIAKQLEISQKTVEVHRSRISREMGVNSVPLLVSMVTEYRLSNVLLSNLT